MNECWTIDQPKPQLRVVKLAHIAIHYEPAVVAEELSLAVSNTFLDNVNDESNATIDINFTAWNEVDSRLFALLLYFHRRCHERGYKMMISSPPRTLSEMAMRLGVASELGLGVARSRDYSQLFQLESRAS